MLKQLHEWFLWLCRVVTRQECHAARAQNRETMRWVNAARSRRDVAERRLDVTLARRN